MRGTDELKRGARWLGRLAILIFVALSLVLLAEAAFLAQASDRAASLRYTGALRLPMLFYLAAVWMIRRACAEIAAGVAFDAVLPTLLRRLGLALALGAAASVFATPWLMPGGTLASFDPPAITVGLVGLLLVVLAGLFRRAAAMARELDEFL